MEGWERFSGTGEQQQEQAFVVNLEKIKTDLESTINNYQSSSIISDERVKKIVDSAQRLIGEIDAFAQTRKVN